MTPTRNRGSAERRVAGTAAVAAAGGPAGLPCEQAYAAAGLGSDCGSEGFVTDSAWGYRARAILEYPNAIGGVTLKPTIAWSHDVSGYSPEPGAQFNEGRKSLGVSVEAMYQAVYTLTVSYTNFSGGDYNTLTDKDFMAVSLGYSF